MQNLVKLRTHTGLKQAEIAEQIGISRQSYCHYETGKREPDFLTLCKLADYFNTTVDYLLGRTELNQPAKIGWTDEEKAAGVAMEETLSADETEWIDLYRALKGEKGTQTVNAIKTMMKNLLEKK